MNEPILVIMAAGMGSRFGGLKQITPVDEYGHIIMDYSLYDARRAGFKRVVFVIKHEIENDFKNVSFDQRIPATVLARQERDKIPEAPENKYIKLSL